MNATSLIPLHTILAEICAFIIGYWASEASPTLGCSIEISRYISESAVALSM